MKCSDRSVQLQGARASERELPEIRELFEWS